MQTRRWTYPSTDASEPVLSELVENIRFGGVIGYPTETVYGLGGDAFNLETIRRIYRLKGRDFTSPLLILVRDREMLNAATRTIPHVAERLIQSFWPGQLTLIFEKDGGIPDALTGGRGAVGVRMSPDPVCRFILSRLDRPLISTSANPSGRVPARTASEVIRYFDGKVEWVIDGGARTDATPSTILDVTHTPPRLIRQGGVSKAQIETCIGAVI
jgi:L-threonylcarbamoyladenylate synthase